MMHQLYIGIADLHTLSKRATMHVNARLHDNVVSSAHRHKMLHILYHHETFFETLTKYKALACKENKVLMI